MIQIKKSLLLPALLVLVIHTSCHNFYKATVIESGKGTATSVDSLRTQNRFFVLRSGGQAFFLKNMGLSNDRKTLTATLDSLPPEHRLHLVNGRGGNMHYRKGDANDAGVLSEVHLYVPTLNASAGETVNLSLDQVQKIEVIEKDKKRTTNSYVIGAIGYTLGALAVATIIIAATKSSCPFVSAHDGNEFVLQGEIYGGAIYPQLARQDYLPLKMAPLADGTLQLMISNELKETQYTDYANLLVVKHAPGTQVLANEEGQLYSVKTPDAPASAMLSNGRDVLFALRRPGDNALAYMYDTTTADAVTTLHLNFQNQSNATSAKLVLTLKNSYWLDQLYGELAKGFGTYYATYMKQQANKPAAELVKWTRDQHMPLSVSVREANGWRRLTDVTTIGPLATRSIVIPVDLKDIKSKDIEIALSCGFLFWEIDYAGLDFSAGDAFSVEELTPVQATDETGKDVLPALQKEDAVYLEQPQIGNTATLVYKPRGIKDGSQAYTYILHTKGYYQHIRNFTNKPDVAFLKQFTKPAAFPQYGKLLYKKIEQENLDLFASNR